MIRILSESFDQEREEQKPKQRERERERNKRDYGLTYMMRRVELKERWSQKIA